MSDHNVLTSPEWIRSCHEGLPKPPAKKRPTEEGSVTSYLTKIKPLETSQEEFNAPAKCPPDSLDKLHEASPRHSQTGSRKRLKITAVVDQNAERLARDTTDLLARYGATSPTQNHTYGDGLDGSDEPLSPSTLLVRARKSPPIMTIDISSDDGEGEKPSRARSAMFTPSPAITAPKKRAFDQLSNQPFSTHEIRLEDQAPSSNGPSKRRKLASSSPSHERPQSLENVPTASSLTPHHTYGSSDLLEDTLNPIQSSPPLFLATPPHTNTRNNDAKLRNTPSLLHSPSLNLGMAKRKNGNDPFVRFDAKLRNENDRMSGSRSLAPPDSRHRNSTALESNGLLDESSLRAGDTSRQAGGGSRTKTKKLTIEEEEAEFERWLMESIVVVG